MIKQDGVIIEIESTLRYDIKLEYDKMKSFNNNQIINYLKNKIMNSLEIINELRVKDFNLEDFKSDLEIFFETYKIEG